MIFDRIAEIWEGSLRDRHIKTESVGFPTFSVFDEATTGFEGDRVIKKA